MKKVLWIPIPVWRTDLGVFYFYVGLFHTFNSLSYTGIGVDWDFREDFSINIRLMVVHLALALKFSYY
jgi:hypothetical protein